jgi:acetoin utilization deacetylase AcuC-like enzyme
VIVYSPRYQIDIGLHVFPTQKYRQVHARLLETGVITPSDVVEPPPASWDDLALVHTPDYLEKLRRGTLPLEDMAQLELPWSPEMVDGFRLMVGGTIRAGLIATGAEVRSEKLEGRRESLKVESSNLNFQTSTSNFQTSTSNFKLQTSNFRDADRVAVAVHIGGGLHHAFPNHGEGFCPFNDVAVAVRVLQQRGLERVAVVDLDVHHGNGTAFIFESDPRVFTFSMHQQHNYPMWKPRGSLDVGLPDGAQDATYLEALERALPAVLAHRPQCVFYLAGADPYEDDQLGGLRLTKEGLRTRDRLVVAAARSAAVPLVVTLAGGYARRVDDTVEIHAATIEEALGR